MNDRREVRYALGARLREEREYLGFSQEDVARHLGVSRSAVSLMESGSRRVDALELQRLARLFQTSMERLTGSLQEDQESESLRLVARAAAHLSSSDRREILRFAQFLRSRKEDEPTP